MRKFSAVAVALLLLLSIPASAAECENPIRAWSFSNNPRTGAPATFFWSLDQPALSQVLTGHDFDEPVSLAPEQRSYTYIPELPGTKHLTLTVTTACGTFTREASYKVDLCNVAPEPITTSKTAVNPGETFTASVDLSPGHTVRWTAFNGTLSSTEGASVQVTAGTNGPLRLSAFVTRGNANSNVCEARSTATVTIVNCNINAPVISNSPPTPTLAPNSNFLLAVNVLGPGETVTFAVHNATVLETGDRFIEVRTPASGTFEITLIVAKTGCQRAFSYTYSIVDCAPKAVVSGSDGCDSNIVSVEFTGTAPFFGVWSDGVPFYTEGSWIERVVTAVGTYTIESFTNNGGCPGIVEGSAVVTALTMPSPIYTIDDVAGGYYYGSRTCPGVVRTARLESPIPAGVTLTWTIENGTIVSGQGTAVVEFYGNAPGPTNLFANFNNGTSCTTQYAYPYFATQGVPTGTVSVDVATIDAGHTAIVTISGIDGNVSGWNLTSSLGDTLYPLTETGDGSFQYEYRSTRGAGVATITLELMNSCGQTSTSTTTLNIVQGAPVTATATVHSYGSDCTNYYVYADLTGTGPFRGTWSNGSEFYSEWAFIYMYPSGPGTYTIAEFSDANGPGTVTGSATFDYVSLPAPEFTYSAAQACPNSTVTATLSTPLPEGAVANWQVQGGTIVSGQGTNSIVIQVGDYAYTTVQLTGPGACSTPAPWQYIGVANYVQPLQFYPYDMYVGSSTTFSVWGDANIANLQFESSMGDPMEIVDNPYPGNYTVRYTSTHGTGTSVIRIYGTTHCGASFEATKSIQILPAPPTATLSVAAGSCGRQIVTVNFTGTAPFTATWSDNGQVFTTSDSTYTRVMETGGWIWLYNFSDATGTLGNANGIDVPWPTNTIPYASAGGSPSICLGSTHTYYMDQASIPAGYQMVWSIEGSARILSGDNETVVVEGFEVGTFILRSHLRSPEGCDGPSIAFNGRVEGEIAAPVINMPVTTVAPGQSIELTMTFADSGLYNTLYWTVDAGTLEYVGSNDYLSFTLRYTAPAEGATSATIKAIGGTSCGQTMETSATVTITP